jgi:hypothetical protein
MEHNDRGSEKVSYPFHVNPTVSIARFSLTNCDRMRFSDS